MNDGDNRIGMPLPKALAISFFVALVLIVIVKVVL
jgi:hypothetical protein